MGADRREGRKADADRGDVAQSDTAATIRSRSSIGSGGGSGSRGRASHTRRVPPFPHPRAQRAPPGAPARATPAPARSEEKKENSAGPDYHVSLSSDAVPGPVARGPSSQNANSRSRSP